MKHQLIQWGVLWGYTQNILKRLFKCLLTKAPDGGLRCVEGILNKSKGVTTKTKQQQQKKHMNEFVP